MQLMIPRVVVVLVGVAGVVEVSVLVSVCWVTLIDAISVVTEMSRDECMMYYFEFIKRL